MRKLKSRRQIKYRILIPDALYNSTLISKFIRYVMYDGKLEKATKIVYSFIDLLKQDANIMKQFPDIIQSNNMKELFEDKLIGNLLYEYETRKFIFGGSGYHIPQKVSFIRSQVTAMKNFLSIARQNQRKNNINIVTALFQEADLIIRNQGSATLRLVNEKKKLVEANKALERKTSSKSTYKKNTKNE